jgi:hypothetical protein
MSWTVYHDKHDCQCLIYLGRGNTCSPPVLAALFICQVFGILRRNLVNRFLIFRPGWFRFIFQNNPQNNTRGSSEISFGKRTIYKQPNTSRSHILTVDIYYSPMFVYFLTCKDVSQFRYIIRE